VAGDIRHGRAAPLSPELADLRRHAPESAVVLDFDGTLAAIVDDPQLARPLPGSLTVLRALVDRFRLVAVVSGRPAAFLAAHLDVGGLVRLGSYGLEEVTATGVVEAQDGSPWRPAVAEVTVRARAAAPAGVLVEDKGLSVTLHHRTAPGAAAWVHAFAATQARETGLVVHEARQSAELRPPVAIDKGTAVASLVARAQVTAACVVGDDIGDLAAFEAVSGLSPAVRVAVGSTEAPPLLLAAADLVVDGPRGVLEVLRFLAG
jgi:trehalose 6-phosphate phosphatase